MSYKKGLNDPDNHDVGVSHLESDILECEVKWGLGSIVKWKSLNCFWLCLPMDYTVHGILQARILEWVAISFSRGSSQPRDQTQVFHITGRFFTNWATREARRYYYEQIWRWQNSS